MLERQETPRATDAALNLIAHEQRAGLAAKGLCTGQVVRRRQIDALALEGLDDEGGNFTRFELARERVGVSEGHALT